jgi:hypothetical protein
MGQRGDEKDGTVAPALAEEHPLICLSVSQGVRLTSCHVAS